MTFQPDVHMRWQVPKIRPSQPKLHSAELVGVDALCGSSIMSMSTLSRRPSSLVTWSATYASSCVGNGCTTPQTRHATARAPDPEAA